MGSTTDNTRTFSSGTVLVGDCLDRLKALPDASIDSIVTDPPYELGFMGKKWDASGIAYNVKLWEECLRVLKPGGHLLAFGGTRTYHRMAVAIEDAGFEIRDSIHWSYGSGFPKSLDVSKAIDKAGGVSPAAQAEVMRTARSRLGWTRADLADAVGCTEASVRDWEEGRARSTGAPPEFITPSAEYREKLADLLGYTSDERRVIGAAAIRSGDGTTYGLGHGGQLTEGGNTPEAERWSGWGTALKPAHEPIVVARKPLDGTVAATVLAHGTGALNIDGCRVAHSSEDDRAGATPGGKVTSNRNAGAAPDTDAQGRVEVARPDTSGGRWPANFVLTHAADCRQVKAGTTTTTTAETEVPDIRGGKMHAGAERGTVRREVATYTDTPAVWSCAPGCPVAELDAQSGVSKSPPVDAVCHKKARKSGSRSGADKAQDFANGHGDTGGASRFFPTFEWDPIADAAPFRYQAKPSKAERDAGLNAMDEQAWVQWQTGNGASGKASSMSEGRNTTRRNVHPTVKPVALMRWLVRLVTPQGGTVLDPFLGSGTTAVAAVLEGVSWVGCEMTEDYLPIIRGRVEWAEGEVAAGRATKPRFKAPAPKPKAEPDTATGDEDQPTLF